MGDRRRAKRAQPCELADRGAEEALHDPRVRVHEEDLVGWLVGRLRAGDLCLTLGAGDLTTLEQKLGGWFAALTL